MPGLHHPRDFPKTSFHVQVLHIHRSLVIILMVTQQTSFAFFFQNILKLSQTTKIPPSSTSTKRSPICSMWLGCSSVPPDQCAARAVFDGRRWPAESPGRSFSSGLNGALNLPDVTYHCSIVPKFRMMLNIYYEKHTIVATFRVVIEVGSI